MARDQSAKSQLKRDMQARQRAWLQEVVRVTGNSASAIAGLSGVSDTTLTRLLNNPDYEGTLSQLTIDRIKDTMRVPGPEETIAGKRIAVLGFFEAERFDRTAAPKALARIIDGLTIGRAGVEAWTLRTDALEAAGYLPGDVVIVDSSLPPQPQDAVCAQVHDYRGGGVETVWRIFLPPYLVAATHDRTAFKPLMIDNDRVVVKGVIVESFRPRRLSATR